MRLAKLSLAAIVAAGAMTTFASAAPLEEAIKGVDLTGLMRYRVDMHDYDDSSSTDQHRFSGVFTFTAPIADNVKSVLTLRYNTPSDARDASSLGTDEENLAVSQAYFQYAVANYSVQAGKMQLATPWTENAWDGDFANGVMAYYTGVEGWTFAGAAFVNNTLGERLGAVVGDIGKQNLYAAAAIGSMGPVDAQFWVSKMEHVFDYSAFLELSTKMAGFSLKGQVNQLKLADETKAALNPEDDKGLFWAVQAGYEIEGFNVAAGYIKNDKDQPIHTLSADGQHIIAGQNLYGDTTNLADAETYFAKAGYAFGDYSVGAGYSKAEQGSNDFGREVYVEAGYDYSKNFSLYSYYSDMDIKDAFTTTTVKDNKQIRFQATYSF